MKIALPSLSRLPSPSSPSSAPLTALVMVSGAGGGLSGPAGLYDSLRHRLTSDPALPPVLSCQLDYSHAAYMPTSLTDVRQALRLLRAEHRVGPVVLLGWSFGGGVVVGAAAEDVKTRAGGADSAVAAIVTIGTQTAGTEGISQLHRGGVRCLLLHGQRDTCLPVRCSQQLYDAYRGRDRELVVYEGDDHGCSQHREDVMKRVEQLIVTAADSWKQRQAGAGKQDMQAAGTAGSAA